MTLEQRHQHQAALRSADSMISHLDQGITTLIDQRAEALAAHSAAGGDASGFTSPIDTELGRYRSALASVESGNPSPDAIALCGGSAVSTQSAPTTPAATAAPGAIDSRIAALQAEQARLRQGVTSGTRIPPAPSQAAAPRQTVGLDHAAQAAAEWDQNHNNCQTSFSTRERFIAYRKAVLSGRHREAPKNPVVKVTRQPSSV